jgi:hypothetical protein
VNSTDRIVIGDAERTEFGRWYVRLRPSGLGLLLVCTPVLGGYQTMIIRRVLSGALSRTRSPLTDTFWYVTMTAFCAWMMYILIRQTARRRFLYVGDGIVRIRSEIFRFQFDARLVTLDRIRTLDYGGQGNLGARGLLIGYVSPDPYLVWMLVSGLTQDETMRIIEVLRPDLPQEIRSGLVCGAPYAKPPMLAPSEAFVISPGVPLPSGFNPHPGRSYSD